MTDNRWIDTSKKRMHALVRSLSRGALVVSTGTLRRM